MSIIIVSLQRQLPLLSMAPASHFSSTQPRMTKEKSVNHSRLEERRLRQFQNSLTPSPISVLPSLPRISLLLQRVMWELLTPETPETTNHSWVWVAAEGQGYWWNTWDRERVVGSPPCFQEEKPSIWGEHHITVTSPSRSSPLGCYCSSCDGQDQADCIIPEPRPSTYHDCRPTHLCSGKASPVGLAWTVWWRQVHHHVWRPTL